MAHFAQLDENNKVINVIVVANEDCLDFPFPESEPLGVAFCQSLYGADTIWKQTSYNASFRYNYAGSLFSYYPDAQPNGAFVAAKPAPNAVLDTNTYQWIIPPTSTDPAQPPAVL